jgi:hypothetical protein
MGVSPSSCLSNPLTPHVCASFSQFSLVGLTDLSSRRWRLGFLPGACLHSVHLLVRACFQSGNNIYTAFFPPFWQKTDQSAISGMHHEKQGICELCAINQDIVTQWSVTDDTGSAWDPWHSTHTAVSCQLWGDTIHHSKRDQLSLNTPPPWDLLPWWIIKLRPAVLQKGESRLSDWACLIYTSY